MSEIKPGMVVYIKTTEEPVYVLAVSKEPDPSALDEECIAEATHTRVTEQAAIVRRPVASEDGIRHTIDDFFLSELETDAARKERAYGEMMGLRDRMRGGAKPGEVVPMESTELN